MDGRIGGVTAYAGWKDRGKNAFWPQMDVKEHSKKFVDWVGTLYSAEEIQGRVLKPAELAALQDLSDGLPMEEKQNEVEGGGGEGEDDESDDEDDESDDENPPPICPPSPASSIPPPLPAPTPPTATLQSVAPAQRDASETPKTFEQMTADELRNYIQSLTTPTQPVQTAQLNNLYEIPASFKNGEPSASGSLTSLIHNDTWFSPTAADFQAFVSGNTLSATDCGSQFGPASTPGAQHHYGVSMDPYVGILPNGGGYTHLNISDANPSGGFNLGGFSDLLPSSLSMNPPTAAPTSSPAAAATTTVIASNTPSPPSSPPTTGTVPTTATPMEAPASSFPTATTGTSTASNTPTPASSSPTATTGTSMTSNTPAPALSPTITMATATSFDAPAPTPTTEVQGPQRRKRKPAKSKEVVPLTAQDNAERPKKKKKSAGGLVKD
ncbi:hypothetical protein BDN72DRAFT_906518 [Pluteus cervinus]|uniref:Uncharacterized protein n=1 Tax=Pluteus cervinus TaxID=181527 RepID=A0ACD2ZZ13_9AGAR|nr:hypothetical protein BDN72DRAFT_906518 [Pluteus cervinus]